MYPSGRRVCSFGCDSASCVSWHDRCRCLARVDHSSRTWLGCWGCCLCPQAKLISANKVCVGHVEGGLLLYFSFSVATQKGHEGCSVAGCDVTGCGIAGLWRCCTLCRRCTLVRAEHVVLLRSLSSVPLTFLAIFRYRASSMCFVQLVSPLVHLLFSAAIALLFLSWLQRKQGHESEIRVRSRNRRARGSSATHVCMR